MRNAMILTGISMALRQAEMDNAGAEGAEVRAADIAALAMDAETPETEDDKQARHARLQAAEAAATATANDGTSVPERVIQVAKAEILICWNEFAGQGGVYDLHKQAQKKLKNIAQHILTIARECAAAAWERTESDPRLDFGKLASAMFRNSIAMAELYLRGTLDLTAAEAEQKLDTFLAGSWRVYCSQVRGATEAGFDPRDHETIYSLRKAVEAAKEATSTGTRDDSGTEGTTTGGAAAPTQTNGQEESEAATQVNQAILETAQTVKDASGEDRNGLDWSELSAIAQGSASVQAALILLHQAIHGTKMDEGNAEERVTNILNVAIREVNKLTRRAELADDGSDGLTEENLKDMEDDPEADMPLDESELEAVQG